MLLYVLKQLLIAQVLLLCSFTAKKTRFTDVEVLKIKMLNFTILIITGVLKQWYENGYFCHNMSVKL